MDFDLGDRLERRTTGVDVAELLMNGQSEERYTYSPRGLPLSIYSSYGIIVESMEYDPDGAPNRIVYGDLNNTTARFTYDSRRRLTNYNLSAFAERPANHFDYHFSAYDEIGNPLIIEDRRRAYTRLPPEASPVKMRKMQYDDLYRLTQLDSTYDIPGGIAPWHSPFDSEISTGDHHPVPLRSLPTRVAQQTFDYDGLGNLTASTDDLNVHYDRSLGPNLGYGAPQQGPNQLQSGEGLQIRYDEAGNLSELKLERSGICPTGTANQCAQWFAYDWDEVGQLARARRWDFDGNTLPPQASPDALPAGEPNWDLTYAYSQGARVRKSVADATDETRHTLEVFDTLRIERASFSAADGNYTVSRENVHAYPGGLAHVFWDTDEHFSDYLLSDSLLAMHMVMGDHLGSSSVIINQVTSELVERTTYQPYGAVESDYRPSKLGAFREPYKFTGKEEDIEVGATYFGARYYQPYLDRFMSADPLTIHGQGSDLNPYTYVGGRVMTSIDKLGLCGGGYAIGEGALTYEYDCETSSHADAQAASGEAAATQQETKTPTSSQPSVTLENVVLGTVHVPIPGTKDAYFTPNGVRKVAVNVALDLLDPLHYGQLIQTFTGKNPFTLHIDIGEDKNDKSAIVGAVVVTAAGIIAGKFGAPPRVYSVAFEAELAATELGLSRGRHFQIANEALQTARAETPALAELVPAPQGWGRPPQGWVWQHATVEQAAGRPGILQLVPKAQHTGGSFFWRLLHPLPGGGGGYAEWAIPAGAPPN